MLETRLMSLGNGVPAAIVVIWAMIVCSRFVALGLHSFEGYILAGIGTAFFLVGKYFLMRMR